MTVETCRRRDTCRLCGGGDLTLVLALTPTPPANAFVMSPKKPIHRHAFRWMYFLQYLCPCAASRCG